MIHVNVGAVSWEAFRDAMDLLSLRHDGYGSGIGNGPGYVYEVREVEGLSWLGPPLTPEAILEGSYRNSQFFTGPKE